MNGCQRHQLFVIWFYFSWNFDFQISWRNSSKKELKIEWIPPIRIIDPTIKSMCYSKESFQKMVKEKASVLVWDVNEHNISYLLFQSFSMKFALKLYYVLLYKCESVWVQSLSMYSSHKNRFFIESETF